MTAKKEASIENEKTENALTKLETLRLGATAIYYSVSRALRLDKVSALLQRADLALDTPVALLGHVYNPAEAPEALSQLVHHFRSTLWMTYRVDFTPLTAAGVRLITDAGWGCTLRSAQMLAGQALQRHVLGAEWRWPLCGEEIGAAEDPPADLASILRIFWDTPDPSSPLSIHTLCFNGSKYGVSPGRWLGPWTACRALEASSAALCSKFGLQVHLVGGGGGGAPVLSRDRFAQCFEPSQSEDGAASSECTGLLLLVPLVLGLGQINPVYLPQLREVLAMPQSVGIVGGRPGSSMFLAGCQGEAVLFLDPHVVQPAALSDADWVTYGCDVLRTMGVHCLDPSMALGFYCSGAADFRALCGRLRGLEEAHPANPLVCVREGPEPAIDGCPWLDDSIGDEDEEEGGEAAVAAEGEEGEHEGAESEGVAREGSGVVVEVVQEQQAEESAGGDGKEACCGEYGAAELQLSQLAGGGEEGLHTPRETAAESMLSPRSSTKSAAAWELI